MEVGNVLNDIYYAVHSLVNRTSFYEFYFGKIAAWVVQIVKSSKIFVQKLFRFR